jgi:hypothetical protein
VASIQLIYSLEGFYKQNVLNNATIQYNIFKCWANYLTAVGANEARVAVEIKAVDNSAAGAGIHTRLHFPANSKTECEFIASSTKWSGKDTDAEIDAANAWIGANIFDSCVVDSIPLPPGYWGLTVYRASMQTCKRFSSFNYPGPSGVSVYNSKFAGSQFDVPAINAWTQVADMTNA